MIWGGLCAAGVCVLKVLELIGIQWLFQNEASSVNRQMWCFVFVSASAANTVNDSPPHYFLCVCVRWGRGVISERGSATVAQSS